MALINPLRQRLDQYYAASGVTSTGSLNAVNPSAQPAPTGLAPPKIRQQPFMKPATIGASPLKPMFDIQRQRALEQVNTDTQQRADALKRRFAAMGGLGSGSFIKQTELQADAAQKAKAEANQAVDMAELQDQAQRQSQLDQQNFTREQQNTQMGFQREMASKDLAFKDKVFGFDKQSKLAQLDLAKRELENDEKTTMFNKALAMIQSGNPAGVKELLADLELQALKQTKGGTSSAEVKDAINKLRTDRTNRQEAVVQRLQDEARQFANTKMAYARPDPIAWDKIYKAQYQALVDAAYGRGELA